MRHFVEMTIEQEVSYGLDYAFEFALTNPNRTPATALNAADLHSQRFCKEFDLMFAMSKLMIAGCIFWCIHTGGSTETTHPHLKHIAML